jgi:hypothetical protein
VLWPSGAPLCWERNWTVREEVIRDCYEKKSRICRINALMMIVYTLSLQEWSLIVYHLIDQIKRHFIMYNNQLRTFP